MHIRICLLVLAAIPAFAMGASDNPDSSFYRHAAQGGMAEVELGNLAQQKSSNPKIKDFGAMMVKDHTAANGKLQSIAASKGIALPSGPSVGQTATKAKLEMLSGGTFDKSYIKGMIKDHEEDIREFRKEAASGQDSDAKAFAVATLPTLQSHLKHIQAIAADAGVAGK
jgi:putative membrane protein